MRMLLLRNLVIHDFIFIFYSGHIHNGQVIRWPQTASNILEMFLHIFVEYQETFLHIFGNVSAFSEHGSVYFGYIYEYFLNFSVYFGNFHECVIFFLLNKGMFFFKRN